MKKLSINLLFLCFLLLSCTPLFAQKIKYSKEMLQKLAQAEIDLFEPVEGKYKSRRSPQTDYQKIDHTIISKTEKLEIRYAILPYMEQDPSTQVPHVEFMRVISSVAPNEDDVPITVHTIPDKDLKKHFNADWGSIAYFQPKPKFANKKHCRLVSLYGDERGMIHIFFLFNDPSELLDSRMYGMRFKTEL